MQDALRKMGFWEIGKGTRNALVPKFQSLFEEAQLEAMQKKGVCSVTLKIIIKPPSAEQDDFWGKLQFETSMSVPKEQSKEFTTQLMDGMITATGSNEAEILQYKLDWRPIPQQADRAIYSRQVRGPVPKQYYCKVSVILDERRACRIGTRKNRKREKLRGVLVVIQNRKYKILYGEKLRP